VNARSLKFQLVAWYAGWLTVLFLVFGIFVYASLGYYLKKSLREALARRARQVADLVQRSRPDWPTLGAEIHSHFAPEANNRLTRVTVNGAVNYVSGAPSDHSFDPLIVPSAALRTDGETFDRRVLPDGRVLLVVVLSRQIPERALVVEEGSSEAPLKATLHAWLAALIAGLVLLIFSAVLGGFRLAHRALTPVGNIIESAERISSHNLSERLPVPNTGDELERLSVALNNMIRRLDEAFQHNQRFLADASHELRTPLTTMRAELEELIGETHGRPDLSGVAESALEEVERLRKIVEGLFAVSRLEAGEALEEKKALDLAELAVSTAEQMILLADDKDIAIACHSSGPVLVLGDGSRLKQVIVNLLDNAIKHTPRGGKIDVSVEVNDSKAVLEVSDNGVGIPQHALSLVFERFYRVDKARSRESGGAGLGLSIVKSICIAHGGRVTAESEEGKGARLKVELPLARNESV